jgi:hypothetical protein
MKECSRRVHGDVKVLLKLIVNPQEIGVGKDKELKIVETETAHTLGGVEERQTIPVFSLSNRLSRLQTKTKKFTRLSYTLGCLLMVCLL